MIGSSFSKIRLPHTSNNSLIVLVLGITLAITGCSEPAAQLPQQRQNIHQATSAILSQQSQYTVSRKFIGQVRSKQNTKLGFEQAGKIIAILVDEGNIVEQGAIIAQQDTELLKIEREQLFAQINQTKADINLVKTNLSRVIALNKKAYSSAQSLDELETKQQILQSSAKRIRAQLKANQIKINKSTLFAPFDAVISERFVSVGEVVSAGSPVLRLLAVNNSEIKIGVPAPLLAQVKVGQTFSITVAQQQYSVELVTKGLDVDPVSRTVQLRFKLTDQSTLINGQLAYLNLPQVYKKEGFWVPISALTDGVRGLWNIYILEPEQNSNLFKLNSRNIEVLSLTKQQAYISGNIDSGQRYLAAGLHRLVPGQLVNSATVSED
jgi:RND family efflux transporter MFP subunit